MRWMADIHYENVAESIVDLLMVAPGIAQQMQDLRDEAPERLEGIKKIVAVGLREMLDAGEDG